jgi:uncharacterized protein YndB with AHSA1/START domain
MTTTSTRHTEVTADPIVPLIRTVREFDAPAEKVFRAHADPDLARQWVGQQGHSVTLDRWDVRTGGAFHYVVSGDGHDLVFHGSFHEVRPNDLIVQTFTFAGQPDDVALERVRFEDLDGGRSRLTVTSLLDSFEARDTLLASGFEDAVNEGYDRLGDFVTR